MGLKDQLKKINNRRIYLVRKKLYLKFYKNIISNNPILGEYAEGEEDWLCKWRKYDKNLSPFAFRIFSRYIGPDMNIFPMELCATLVEPVFNPYKYIDFYSDKNAFDLIFSELMPETLLRNVNGKFLTKYYDFIDSSNIDSFISKIDRDCVILKPTCASSGDGVSIFYRNGEKFCNKKGDILNETFLNLHYGQNFILQECFRQSDFTVRFNPSSVNTIRIGTYRDLKGQIHILRAIMRIGANGSEVDNAHAGGMFCGIDDDGRIGNYVCDQYGNRAIEFNDVIFENNNFVVPNYELIKATVLNVAKKIIHHDLIAFDVVLDKENNPKLLEINVGGFSGWLFQFTSGTQFREYTDDIVEYCYKKYNI